VFVLGAKVVEKIWVSVPFAPVNQPPNVALVLVGMGNVPIAVPGVRVTEAGLTVPPFGFHVIVTVRNDTVYVNSMRN